MGRILSSFGTNIEKKIDDSIALAESNAKSHANTGDDNLRDLLRSGVHTDLDTLNKIANAINNDPNLWQTLTDTIDSIRYGLKYTWMDADEMNAQQDMKLLEQGLNLDNRTVYMYNGFSWVAIYTLDIAHMHDWSEVTGKPSTYTPTTENVQDIVGAMLSGNSELGASLTYNDTDGKVNIDVNDFTLTINGDASGSGIITNLGDTTITLTIADNSHGHIIANITGLRDELDSIHANIAASAYGIKYKWANETERNAQVGMENLEQGLQVDNRTVYRYNGSVWEVFYTLDGIHNHDDIYYRKTETDTKLAGKVDNSRVLTDVPASAVFTDTVYVHPSSHSADMIDETSTRKWVSPTEKNDWNAKIPSTEKAQAGGVATLDGEGLIPVSQIPPDIAESTAEKVRSNQSVAGINEYDLMHYNGTTFETADFTVDPLKPVNGIAFIEEGTTLAVVIGGIVDLTNVLDIDGNAIEAGQIYYVDQTNTKKITKNKPTTGWVQALFHTFKDEVKNKINGKMMDVPIFHADSTFETMQIGRGLILEDGNVLSVNSSSTLDEDNPIKDKMVDEVLLVETNKKWLKNNNSIINGTGGTPNVLNSGTTEFVKDEVYQDKNGIYWRVKLDFSEPSGFPDGLPNENFAPHGILENSNRIDNIEGDSFKDLYFRGFTHLGNHQDLVTLATPIMDLNDINHNSIYNFYGGAPFNSANIPADDGWWFVHTMVHSNSDTYRTQIIYPMNQYHTQNRKIWTRVMEDGSWRAWRPSDGIYQIYNQDYTLRFNVNTMTGKVVGGVGGYSAQDLLNSIRAQLQVNGFDIELNDVNKRSSSMVRLVNNGLVRPAIWYFLGNGDYALETINPTTQMTEQWSGGVLFYGGTLEFHLKKI